MDGGLWDWLQPTWSKLRRWVHYQRIESSTSEGTPDLEVAALGRQAWAELKAARLPADAAKPVRVKFRPGQADFLVRRTTAGCRAALVIRVLPAKGSRALGHLVIDGRHAPLVEKGLPLAALMELTMGHFEADQLEILRVILELPIHAVEGRLKS